MSKEAWGGESTVTIQPLHKDGENSLLSASMHSEVIRQLTADRDALAAHVEWLQSVAEELRLKLDAEEEKTNTLKEYIDKVVKQSKIAIRQCSRKDFYIDEIEKLDEVIDSNPLRVNHILMEKRVVFHEN